MKRKHFLQETSWEIRQQILDYHATQTMSDVERAAFLGLPNKCRIRENAKILSIENLKIGENVWIGEGAVLDASGGLEIGSNSQIGLGVYLWSHSTHKAAVQGLDTREHRETIKRKATRIGKDCFIGGPSLVMPGVTVGNRCIIAPFSVVYADLPDGAVYRPYRDMLDSVSEVKALREEIQALKADLAELKQRLAE